MKDEIWAREFEDSQNKLILRYTPDQAPHLNDMNKSMEALYRLHKVYFLKRAHIDHSILPYLALDRVYEGSLAFDFINQMQNINFVDVLDHINHVIEFGKYLRDGFMFFLKQKKDAPGGLSSEEGMAFADMLYPSTHSGGGGLNIIATDGGTNNITVNIGHAEAQMARSNALNWVGIKRLPAEFTRSGVVFRWFQAREESGRRGGDKGIIESISEKQVNVGFSNDAVKADMLGEALFKMAYVVDVHCQAIEGEPVYYRITKVEDKFPI